MASTPSRPASTTGASHKPYRHRLPDERAALTHKFCIAGHEGYIHVGLYPDGKPGELFIKMSKQGSSISGLCDTIALLFSLCLQYNVPLEVLIDKLEHMRYEPYGFTPYPAIGQVSSIMDYLAKWLRLKFVPEAKAATDEYSGGMPIAENDPVPRPWTEDDSNDLEQRHKTKTGWQEQVGTIQPIDTPQGVEEMFVPDGSDAVLEQAIKLGSNLTAPIDPTKGSDE